MSSASLPLTSLEVSVRSGSTPLARLKLVRVHGKAHAAAGLSPIEASLDQDLVKSFTNSLLLNKTRTRHNHSMHARRHLSSLRNSCDLTNVLDPSVCTRADENFLNLNFVELLVGLEPHVLKCTFHARPSQRIRFLGRIRNITSDGRCVLRRGAPSHSGLDVFGIDHYFCVVLGARIRLERLPVSHGLVPLSSLGSQRPSLEVLERCLVRRNHTRTCSCFDGHVADGHPGLHRQLLDG
mmetsp:Transcript_4624/g.16817  ORF Transcript_4624/g.16817 Transcript_4624/m.16817 type:complete len:238 (-) Transcript_4624:854-1567(-)